ncbi:MAG: S8 family serine peptidase [Anaerolineales bacterium]|nr:S8 family serine peptidase [Anaerolineales bacterium]
MRKSLSILLVALTLALTLASFLAGEAVTAPKDDQVRVWVAFEPGKKGAAESALQANGAQFYHTFDELNAFAVSIPESAIAGLSHNPNIAYIEEDAPRYLYTQEVPYGIDKVQARNIWDANLDGVLDPSAPTGAGRLVCIIDSGIKADHEDFANVNLVGGYPSGWNTDSCGHGTHVAGTIAATNNNLGVVGVTPGTTSLYIVKVFDGADCGWSFSSDLVAAANQCAAAGADIISMSLGGSIKSRTEDRAFANLYNQGILSIAAAGNDGNTRLSYPASYASVMSVAAVDSNNVIADFSQQNSSVEIAAPGVGVLSTVPWKSTNILTVDGVDYSGNHIDYAPYISASGALVNGGLCDSTGAWSGKVVLCERGVISFYDKVINVQNSGGAAAVIYNNEPGNFLGTLGDGYSSDIPAISLSQENGQFLIANKLGQTGVVTSNFDSNGSGYEAWDGTSMATPHISGVAALIWSSDTTKTNAEIRQALTATALDLGAAGKDNAYGYGLAQAFAAWQYLGGGGGVDPTPTPEPTPEPTPVPGGTMHVAAIAMDYSIKAVFRTVYTTVTIVDADGNPVANATVTLAMSTPDGPANGSAVTGSDGTVIFSYKSKSGGVYTSTVADVTHASYTYDAGANVITSHSITVP